MGLLGGLVSLWGKEPFTAPAGMLCKPVRSQLAWGLQQTRTETMAQLHLQEPSSSASTILSFQERSVYIMNYYIVTQMLYCNIKSKQQDTWISVLPLLFESILTLDLKEKNIWLDL